MNKDLRSQKPLTHDNRHTISSNHRTSVLSPPPIRDDGMPQPRSEYLREMLAEKKAKRMRECNTVVGQPRSMFVERYERSLCSSMSLSSSSSDNAQDDWIFDSDKESCDLTGYSSRRRRSEAMTRTPQGSPRPQRQNSARDSRSPSNKKTGDASAAGASKIDARLAFGAKTTERAMGHRETRSVVDRLEKENFDLKLRITLQEERMARITTELDDALALSRQADEFRRERDKLQVETAESLEMNEQLVKELERRDYAVEEAAGIIQEMEERMEDVRHALAEGEKEWRRQWLQQGKIESDGHRRIANQALHGDDVRENIVARSATRDFPGPTRFDGDNSRPSTAVHDSDYFSAESSPTRSLPLQQQKQAEIPPLSSCIRLLGRPSTLSLISQFTIAEPGFESVRSDVAESATGSHCTRGSKIFEGEDHVAYSAKIMENPISKTAEGKGTISNSFGNYDNKVRNQFDASNVRNDFTIPQISSSHSRSSPSSSSSSSSNHDRKEEEDAERTIILDQAIVPQTMSAASHAFAVKSNQQEAKPQQLEQQREISRSHSVRMAGSRTDMRRDFQKTEDLHSGEERASLHEQRPYHLQPNQSPQQHNPKERQRYENFKLYQQRRLYHNVNQVANTAVVSTPDAQLVRVNSNVANNQSEPVQFISLQSIEGQQNTKQQYESHSQLQKALRRRNAPLQLFDSFSGRPGLELKRDCDGSRSDDGINGNDSVNQKIVKRDTEKGLYKKEKGKERAHLMDAGNEKKSTGSPYSTFLAATASLKAFTNITSAASARLARAGSIGSRPGLKLGPKKPAVDGIAGAHAKLTMTPFASTKEYNGGDLSNVSAIADEHTSKGLNQRPTRSTRPRANTIDNVVSSSSTIKVGIDSNLDAASAATARAPPLTRNMTISTPNTNNQRYLILHGHHQAIRRQTSQRQLGRQRRLDSQSTNTENNLANENRSDESINNRPERSLSHHEKNKNDGTSSSKRSKSKAKLGSQVHKRPLPPTPPTHSSPPQHNQKLQHSVLPASSSSPPSPPSPTPTTVSDPTESMCSFNVEAWGGPPTYKALPREGVWAGMSRDPGKGTELRKLGFGSSPGRGLLPPRNLFFDGSEE